MIKLSSTLFGAESMAKEALYSDYLTTGIKIDHLGEIWASNFLLLDLDEGGFLEIHVTDLNALRESEHCAV
jgi:General secretion pathway protein K.